MADEARRQQLLAELKRRGLPQAPSRREQLEAEVRRRGLDQPQTLDQRAERELGLKQYKQRGTILPIGEDEQGNMELAWPQIGVDLAKSFMLPRHAMEGGSYTADDTTKFAMDYPLGLTMARAPGMGRTGTAKEIIKKAPSTEELFERGGALYDKAEATGVTLKPEKYLDTLIQLDDTARLADFDPDLHPRIARAKAVLEKKLDAQQPVDVRGMINMRKHLSDVARDKTPGNASEARVASIMVNKLDQMVDNLTKDDVVSGDVNAVGPILTEARKTWQRAKKSELIEEAIDKASRQASGFENGLRIQFRQLRNSKKAMQGFSADEKAAIDDIIDGGPIQTALRKLGKLSFGFHGNNTLGGAIATGAGALGGGWPGALLAQIPGIVAGKLAERATMGRADLARAMAASGKGLPSENAYTQALRRAAPVVGALINPGENDKVLPIDDIQRKLIVDALRRKDWVNGRLRGFPWIREGEA